MQKQALTIDVEDYFQVSAFAKNINIDDWDSLESRVEMNTNRLLDLFESHNAKATFFMLGWVAKKFPELTRRIGKDGHELGSHGMLHQLASLQTPKEFQTDVGDTKRLLEDIVGDNVIKGYRAPSFSFTKSNLWVYDILKKEGYRYSSSVYPVVHDHYGIPDAPRSRYTTESGIDEIPLSTLKIMGKNMPISGGGYFRLYPYFLTRWAIKRFTNQEENAYIFYMHPWEIDPEQPRVEGISLKSRFRHYLNLSRTEKRLSNMLSDFEWFSMAELYGYK